MAPALICLPQGDRGLVPSVRGKGTPSPAAPGPSLSHLPTHSAPPCPPALGPREEWRGPNQWAPGPCDLPPQRGLGGGRPRGPEVRRVTAASLLFVHGVAEARLAPSLGPGDHVPPHPLHLALPPGADGGHLAPPHPAAARPPEPRLFHNHDCTPIRMLCILDVGGLNERQRMSQNLISRLRHDGPPEPTFRCDVATAPSSNRTRPVFRAGGTFTQLV